MPLKLFLLSLLSPFLFLNNLNAQNINRCITQEKIDNLISADPALNSKMQNSEQKIQNWIAANTNYKVASTLVVPVVVHVLYRIPVQNIPDAQIQTQIAILNKDYRKLNSDTSLIPASFKPVSTDMEIEFCLAKRDPFGNVTNGITRKSVSTAEIGNTNTYYKSNLGGEDIWDRNFYLNIWVCEIEALGGTLGYSTVPSYNPSPSSDGVVIDYRYFGTSTNSHYNKGRTATHEIGHWFDLQHVWGDDFGLCSIDDFVSDTPLQTLEHYGMPTFPSLDSCSSIAPGTMFMNYMDYTDDSGMNMFTQGQKLRVWAALNTTFRDSLFNSKGCVPVGIDEASLENQLTIYPNPFQNEFKISFNLSKAQNIQLAVYDLLGKTQVQSNLKNIQFGNQLIDLANFPKGIYLIKIASENESVFKKVIKN